MSDKPYMYAKKTSLGTFEIEYHCGEGRSGEIFARTSGQIVLAKEINMVDNEKVESVKVLNLNEEHHEFKNFVYRHIEYLTKLPRTPLLPAFRDDRDEDSEV